MTWKQAPGRNIPCGPCVPAQLRTWQTALRKGCGREGGYTLASSSHSKLLDRHLGNSLHRCSRERAAHPNHGNPKPGGLGDLSGNKTGIRNGLARAVGGEVEGEAPPGPAAHTKGSWGQRREQRLAANLTQYTRVTQEGRHSRAELGVVYATSGFGPGHGEQQWGDDGRLESTGPTPWTGPGTPGALPLDHLAHLCSQYLRGSPQWQQGEVTDGWTLGLTTRATQVPWKGGLWPCGV